jgi:hypothetical protein
MWMPSRKAGIRIGHNIVPTQQRLKEAFDYQDGYLIAKRSHGIRKAGQRVGTLDNGPRKGYYFTSVDGETYAVHRLVWVWHHGPIPPELVIDHIDRIRTNNRIENLRLVTLRQNSKNQKRHNIRRTRSVPANVYHIRTINKYRVIFNFGSFDTVKEAAQRRAEIVRRLGDTL